jgi:hypothetical protein
MEPCRQCGAEFTPKRNGNFCSVTCMTRAARWAKSGGPIRKFINWDAQPLGRVADAEIARAIGCAPTAVSYARERRGIPPLRPQRKRCDPSVFAAEFGTAHDREIAERHGVGLGQVTNARRKAGLPGHRISWDQVSELGTMPDIFVARKYGVDNKVVAEARWRRGIEKWQERRTCPCGGTYIAFRLDQKFCSYRCQRYHWQLVHRHGYDPRAADCGIALRAYRNTLERMNGSP